MVLQWPRDAISLTNFYRMVRGQAPYLKMPLSDVIFEPKRHLGWGAWADFTQLIRLGRRSELSRSLLHTASSCRRLPNVEVGARPSALARCVALH